ncbi:protein kinase [Streptomyces sp. RS10V-4]|uniref:serine/threonine-protein kinase n=1 Tax=Streptomyces rhizoryzae TaxID=2932493 RepID=UPI002005BDF3|nr:serine/threonine-protein kinase [Streptomyces rhizoryzae]MCK7626026.1 protein kinase [Streptomyces rhizoryzae]
MTGTGIRPLGGDDPARLGGYELLGRLASGGMGRVYVARSVQDGAPAAVKTLLAEGAVSETDRRRFAREVTLARRIDSAYTARVLDADAHAERPWMAIEYIPAPSLAELTGRAGTLGRKAVHWVAAGVAQALVALHDAGIVHRDVKPQNVLLPLDGPRVIDFGISHAHDMTRTQLTLGTIAFTSPEQARAEPSTAASDVYSLGATLFHAAVGRPPYPETADTIRLLTLVQRGALDLTGLPPGLAGLIRPCLAADPRDRPAPAEVLGRVRDVLGPAAASRDGRRRLPVRWTALIAAYEAQGRALRAEGGAAAPTVDLRTRPVPPPGRTRVYTAPFGAAPGGEAPRRSEPPERPKPQQPKPKAQKPKAPKPKPQQPKAQRPPAGKSSAQQAEGRRTASARTPGSPSSPKPARRPEPAPAPGPQTGSSGGTGWAVIALLAVLLFVWKPWEQDRSTDTANGTPGSGTSSAGGTYTGSGPGSFSGGSAGRSSGRGGTTSSATPAPPSRPRFSFSPTPLASRTPSAVDLAFSAVRAGDCLDAYADGYGKWSRTPPARVDCQAANAALRVRSVLGSGTCPSGPGRTGWWHVAADFSSVGLCVERQFRIGQCFLAGERGGQPAAGNLLTLWNCGATRVPAQFRFIMQITAVLPASAGTRACPPDQGRRYTYSWQIDDGRSILCTKVA